MNSLSTANSIGLTTLSIISILSFRALFSAISSHGKNLSKIEERIFQLEDNIYHRKLEIDELKVRTDIRTDVLKSQIEELKM